MIRSLSVALLLLMDGPVIACGLAEANRVALADKLTLEYHVEPEPIEIAEHFTLLLDVCVGSDSVGVDNLWLDALMPAHGHGMSYQPAIRARADSGYEASGMLFHMPGDWQLIVKFEYEGRPYDTALNITL